MNIRKMHNVELKNVHRTRHYGGKKNKEGKMMIKNTMFLTDDKCL
jgi:hypothetical protein